MDIKTSEGKDKNGAYYKEVAFDNISIRTYQVNTYICDWDGAKRSPVCMIRNDAFFKHPIKWLLPVVFIQNKKALEKALEYLKGD